MDALSRELLGKPLVVTSLNDGGHKEGSLHYQLKALDARTRHLTPAEGALLLDKAKAILDPQGYDTITEGQGTPGSTGSHIHFEFDPKAGEVFITLVD
jgi:hypothetical protein